MKIIKMIFWIIVILVLALVAFMWYMGFFGSVKIVEQQMGPYTIAYKSFVGEYSQTGAAFNDVYTALKQASIETTTGLGIYYDNPNVVAKDKLRSDCGSVISPKDASKAKNIGKDIKVKTIPQSMSMVYEFPLKNTISLMFGPLKAYPAIMKYMEAKGYKPAMMYEVYDMKANKILYVTEIKK